MGRKRHLYTLKWRFLPEAWEPSWILSPILFFCCKNWHLKDNFLSRKQGKFVTTRMRDGRGLWPVFITCLCSPCKDCRCLFLQGLCQMSFSLVYTTCFCCSLCWKNLMYCHWHDDQLQSTDLRCRALKSTQVIWFFLSSLLTVYSRAWLSICNCSPL